MKRRNGFTLVELSIVLVIIGLLIGGILVGKSMIETARVRSVMKEMSSIDIQIHQFKQLYNYWPGDYPNTAGFPWTSPSGGTGGGDGNNSISGISSGEGLLVFHHLNYGLGLSKKYPTCTPTFNGFTGAHWNYGCGVSTDSWYLPGINLPKSSWSDNRAGYAVYSQTISGEPKATIVIFGTYGVAAGANAIGGAMRPTEVLAFDSKFDDGRYDTGKLRGAGLSGGWGVSFGQQYGVSPNAYWNYNQSTTTPVSGFSWVLDDDIASTLK
jgi:prepilin-type N-terminal cleavage/methylation domain-containing protein